MSAFLRFPHTPHIAWLGAGQPRDDKVLEPSEVSALLAGEVQVEEKVDGANVGISVDQAGGLRLQNRGSFLERQSCHPQFKPLFRWLQPRNHALIDALGPHLILFGEWCWAVHSVHYTALPDWFLAFDVYDVPTQQFWDSRRRNELVSGLGLALVPHVATGRFELPGLAGLLGGSQLADAPAEGLYIRRDADEHLVGRAKLVRAEFTQGIDAHWTKKRLETNQLASGAAWREPI